MYLALLKALLNWELFNKYGDYLDYQWLKENQPETFRLFQTARYLHEQVSNKNYSVDDVELAFATLYPQSKTTDFAPLFLQLRSIEVDATNVESHLNTLRQRSQATQLAKIALGVAEGTKTEEELQAFLAQTDPVERETRNDFVDKNLKRINEKRRLEPGLRWRLPSLNTALGSIRKGNFGFIVARPETGKTTFLASEITHMAQSVNRPILWFNNEEEHEAVIYRLYQAAYGVDYPTLLSREDEFTERFEREYGDKIQLITDTPTTRKLVEDICRHYPPSLVVLDQIDKVQGFSDDRNDLELKAIYGWAREIAKQHAPVIGVCQAGGTGEGKRWLTMNDVDNSKTGKQGEADWILGIGKVPDTGLETYRYFHLSKNKLQGDADTIPSRRHDNWEVRIHPDIARYADIT